MFSVCPLPLLPPLPLPPLPPPPPLESALAEVGAGKAAARSASIDERREESRHPTLTTKIPPEVRDAATRERVDGERKARGGGERERKDGKGVC